MKSREMILLDNPVIYASLIYVLCKSIKKCDVLYPFFILPIITDKRYETIISTRGKGELFYLISRMSKENKEGFFAEYNQIIIRKKEVIFDALKLCIENKIIKIRKEDEYVFIKEKKNLSIDEIKENILVKNTIKFAKVCSKTTLPNFIMAMKVRV